MTDRGPTPRAYALAVTPYACVGAGLAAVLAGLGCAVAVACGAATVVVGAMLWLDLRGGP